MKIREIIEGSKQDEARAEAQEMARHSAAAIDSITTSYRNGHIQYALALKQLCHHNLTVQQAKAHLDNP